MVLNFGEAVALETCTNLMSGSGSSASKSGSTHGHAFIGSASSPKVAILLCTFHGQYYLADQLNSFSAQTYTNWAVWASDDGSQDDTHAILETYKAKWNPERLSVHFGPEEGFAANFLSLTCKASIQADYYAYSDQDDIWEADKLQRAIDCLQAVPKHIPALYCSRTHVVDANNNSIRLSPLFTKPPSFANALMQNIGGGNTMVFNEAARSLLCEAGNNVQLVTHDWWAYLVVIGCGGQVFYDPYPSVRYRQHGSNLVGMNTSWPARFARIQLLFQGRFREWNDLHIQALERVRSKLTPDNRETLDRFAAARKRWVLPRLIALKQTGIHRQSLLSNLGLALAALFNKI